MNQKIRKAVIPVAGLGTRMLPASKAIPKEMLPIVDKPLIQYIVSECVAAGITEIVLVTHSSKNAIENHFDKDFELETILESKNKTDLLEEIRSICPDNVSIMSVRQGEAKGLGHAVLCARSLVGEEAFAVILPDVLIDDAASDLRKDNLAEMIRFYENDSVSQIMVEPVPHELVSSYGVANIGGVELAEGGSAKMTEVVEKPPVESAPSNLAVVGRYVLSEEIWDLLEKTPKGAGGEIQLTDAIAMLMNDKDVNAFHITGRSHDCGSKRGYLEAILAYGMRHADIGEDFTNIVKSYAK